MKPYKGVGVSVRQTGGFHKPVGSSGILTTGGELDITNSSGFTETSVLGGAMVLFPREGQYTPFVDAMAGLSFCCESADFTLQFGGGADIDINRWYWLRASVVLRRVFYEGTSEGSLAFRVGLVLPVPRR